MIFIWGQFLLAVLIIIIAGSSLSKTGDKIGEKTGLGGLWVGVMLLAITTSLPEGITAVSSVLLVDEGGADLAVGDILGSNLFNLTIIVLLDLLHGKGSFLINVSQRHLLSASLGLILAAIVAFSIVLGKTLSFFGVGLDSILLLSTYLFGGYLIFKSERSQRAEGVLIGKVGSRLCLKFAASAMVVVLTGMWLAHLGDEIAKATGLSHSFVGSIFLAIATSLPEVVVCLGALRLGNLEMAVGNVLGSNMFNISLIFFADIFFRKGPILSFVSSSHALSAILCIILTNILMIGLICRSKKGILRLEWTTIAMFIVYLFGAILLFNI